MSLIAFVLDIEAPAQRVFDAAVDWRGQDRWMPMTTVRPSHQAGIAVGGEIVAATGIGPLAFVDTMTITRWDVGSRVDVMHTGALIRGPGIIRIVPTGPDSSRLFWAEDIDVPFGLPGKVGWLITKPMIRVIIKSALHRFARLVEAGELGTKA